MRGRRDTGARLGRSRRRVAPGQERGKVSAKIVAATLDQNLHTGANMEYQALPARGRVDGDDRRRGGRGFARGVGAGAGKEPWKQAAAGEARRPTARLTMEQIADAARGIQRSRQRELLHARPRLAVRHLAVPERPRLSRQGRRRRAGLRSRPLGRLGARAARPRPLRDRDARRRRLLHGRDRDLDRRAPPHSAARPINNNRSYFNDELHQETVARTRGREVEEPLDRVAHGGPGARHRQVRRGARRGRHRAGHRPRPRCRRRSPRASACSSRAASA